MMLLLGFGEGLKNAMTQGRSGLSSRDLVILWPGSTTKAWQGMKPGRNVRFSEEDAKALQKLAGVDEVAGERVSWGSELRYGRTSVTARVTGVLPCYERIRSHEPRPGGRFLNDEDQRRGRRVIFLGPELQDRLFGGAEAVGQTVFLRGIPFTVVGVMVNKLQSSSYGGMDIDKASIPLSTFESLFGTAPYNVLVYAPEPGIRGKDLEKDVRAALARRQQFDPEDESAVFFWDTGHNREVSDRIMKGTQIFLGGVGAMTLLVAGVGLANMLFVLIHRRTREIGLMMAVGAQKRVVVWRTVGESLLLAGLGGYLGLAASWAIVELLWRIPVQSRALQFLGKPTLSIPLGAITAICLVGIGCLAGSFPARRAARLNPVEALRHE
jgi:putative ABC transport system permease protein